MKLAITRIITKDVPTLARFYQEITGITPWVGQPENYIEFRTSGGVLAIGSQRNMDLFGAGGAVPAANRSAIIEFQVEDVDKDRIRLQHFVHEWVLEPVTQPWGNRSMLFRDPDGNLINFFTPVERPRNPAEVSKVGV
jgi:catechol 2,3-dioxygenase-like lactoylglutathione lyase family enzyme